MTTEKKDYEIVDDYYHACNKRDKKLTEKWTKENQLTDDAKEDMEINGDVFGILEIEERA